MIRRIELVNFMSHARTVIELAAGLTVLIGPNNCGKSAVVTALQILCYNGNSTYVTRHGERECSIAVETDDGHVVTWCRKNNSPRYTIDGQLFDRLNRGELPAKLHEVLRLPRVAAEGDRQFDVHFGEQKSPVFLLDESDQHAARFFASSSDAARFIEMQKRHKLKLADARRERIQTQALTEKLAAELEVLLATGQIQEQVAQVESRHEELGQLASDIEHLRDDIRELENRCTQLSRVKFESAVLAELASPPLMDDPKPIGELIAALGRNHSEWERQSLRTERLSALQPCPDVSDEKPLRDAIVEIESLAGRVGDFERELGALDALPELPELIDTGEMQAAIRALQGAMKHADALAKEAARAEQAARDGERALREWAEDRRICPTCGGSLDADHLVAHAEAFGEEQSHV